MTCLPAQCPSTPRRSRCCRLWNAETKRNGRRQRASIRCHPTSVPRPSHGERPSRHRHPFWLTLPPQVQAASRKGACTGSLENCALGYGEICVRWRAASPRCTTTNVRWRRPLCLSKKCPTRHQRKPVHKKLMSEEKKNVAPTFDAVLKSATDYRNEVRRAMRASEALHFVMAVKT